MYYTFKINYKQLTGSGKSSVSLLCEHCRTMYGELQPWAYDTRLQLPDNISIENRFSYFCTLINNQDFSWITRPKALASLKLCLCFCDKNVIDLEYYKSVARAKEVLRLGLMQEGYSV